jgi:hypothetical protein
MTTSAEIRRAATWATLGAAALIAHQVAGRATRDALFLSTFEVRYLPLMMMAAAALSIAAVLGMSRLLSRLGPVRVVPLAVGTSAVLLMAEWALSQAAPGAAAIAVYTHMAFFGATLVSGFWSVINERFDPYTAKRVVGPIGTGAAVGGVVGGALAWASSRIIPPSAMLLVMSGLTIAALWSMVSMGHAPVSGTQRVHTPSATGALESLKIVGRTAYLRSLALIVGVSALAESVLDYALSAQAKATFASAPEQLMSFFSLYQTGVALLALLLQATLARRSLRSVGLVGSMAAKPAAFLLGGVLGTLSPQLWIAALARGLPAALHNSLFRSGYELLYTPLSENVKRPTKTIVDVGIDKVGAFLGSGVAFALVWALPTLAPGALFAIAALAGVTVILACRGVHRGYIHALEQSLRSGAVSLESSDVLDSTTLHTLAQTSLSLEHETLLRQVRELSEQTDAAIATVNETSSSNHDREDAIVRDIIELRSSPQRARRVLAREDIAVELVPHIVPLLERGELLSESLRALRQVAPRVTGLLTDALLDPHLSPTVRRRIPRVLKACPTRRSVDALLLALGDERFDVRFECGRALARLRGTAPALRVPEWDVYDTVLRELSMPGNGVSTERRVEHIFNVLSLVLEREPLRIAYWAIWAKDEAAIRGTALEYLQNVLPERVHRALWSLMGPGRKTPAPARPRSALVEELLRQPQPFRSSARKARHGEEER